jgi:hypothetical protein
MPAPRYVIAKKLASGRTAFYYIVPHFTENADASYRTSRLGQIMLLHA